MIRYSEREMICIHVEIWDIVNGLDEDVHNFLHHAQTHGINSIIEPVDLNSSKLINS